MDYFEQNMQLLKKKNSKLYKKIKDYRQSDRMVFNDKVEDNNIIAQIKDLNNDLIINIEKAKREGYTIKVISSEGNSSYLNSKYNPFKEASSLVKNLKLKYNAKDQILALGFGLGYHLNELMSKDRFDRVFIIEPYLSIFYAAMLVNDLGPIFKNKRAILVIEEQDNIYSIIRKYYQVSLTKELNFFEHPPSIRMFEEVYKQSYDQIKNAIQFQTTTIATDVNQAYKWRNNIISNLPYILRNPKAGDFFNAFKNIPAICVSAGPSLDKNINQLKKTKGKALILCVGTALSALLNAGIEPDIVVTMDGNKANYKRFKGTFERTETFLFTEKGNYNLINSNWQGPQVYFTMKRNLSKWVEEMKGEYNVIRTGGTVAHSMVDLAYKFGTDPIVLVGQDLAYPTANNKTHAEGINHLENEKINRDKLYPVEGINDNEVYASKQFKTFINYFNDYFTKRSDRTYIDATEGGAKIKETKIMTLEETINQYLNKNYNPEQILKEIYKDKKATLNNELSEFRIELEETIDELEKSIALIRDQVRYLKKVEDNINSITENQFSEVESKLKNFETKLTRYNKINYFVNKTLITEKLKYEEVNNKYYFNDKNKFNEKIKYYRSYRVRFLNQLEVSLKLLSQVYKDMSS